MPIFTVEIRFDEHSGALMLTIKAPDELSAEVVARKAFPHCWTANVVSSSPEQSL
ncbi:hypothetical protein [Cupriavidus campinensis]|uniref:hypothetical protein n=1 Tax=Cupriavidus campinensis TaxID=151783 RepID=UPI001642FC76|nr:hypothetical protein [Cupriavidus campinensis]